MKKFLLFLMFALFCIPWVTNAQNTLTVCDGTENNEYVPFYGYYADEDQHNQMIFPAAELTVMNGQNITQMVFYIDESAGNGSNTSASRLGTWTVSLGETSATTLDGLDGTTVLTQVYEGNFDCSTGTLTLVFDVDYNYQGGNLLVDLNHAAASWNHWFFLGVTANGASYCYSAQRNFLPKTTFSYETPPACPAPTGVTASDITTDGATVSWTGLGETYNLRYRESVPKVGNDFENGFGDWTTIDADGDGYNWILSSVLMAGYSVNSHDGADMVSSQSYDNDGGGALTPDNYLVSPKITLGGSISFWAVAQDGDYSDEKFGVAVSTTGNTSAADFTTIQYWIAQGEWTKYTVDLSDYSGEGYVAIRHFDCTDMFYLNVDGIVIEQPNDISWTEVNNIDDNSYTMTGLEPGTEYEVQVQADCGTEGTSEWASTTFTTLPLCLAPTALTYSNVTPFTVDLAWTAAADATAWQICVNGDEDNLINVTENPYTLTGLNSETTYTVKVRTDCGETGTSDWSNTINFTTAVACPAPTGLAISDITTVSAAASWDYEGDVELEYVEDIWRYYDNGDFGTSMGAGGEIYWGILLTPDMLGDESLTMVALYETANNQNPTTISIYSGGDNAPGTLLHSEVVTPAVVNNFHEITLSEAVEFNASQNLWIVCHNNADNYPAAGSADLSNPNGRWVSLDGTEWSDIDGYGYNYTWMIRAAFGTQPEWLPVVNPVTPQTIANLTPDTKYKVRLRALCGGEYGNSNWTESTFTTEPTCLVPTGLAATTITTNSADLSWTANSEETAWTLYWKESGAEEYTEVAVTAKPYTLSGLNAATTYEFYVVANCSETDASESSDVCTFTTACAAVTDFPWTENFNGLTAGIPNCWDNSEGTTTNASYRWNYYATGHDGAGLRFNSYINSSDLTNFLKTPTLSLPANEDMQLTFWYKNPTGGDFSVYISTDGGTTHETALTTGLTGVSEWTEHTAINLSAYAGQEIVVVFKGTSNYGNGDAYIYLDDVTIDEIPACPAPTDLTYSINAGGVTVGWNGTSDSYNVQLGVNNPVELFSADFADGIPADMTNDATYPWTVVDGYIKSSNAGVSGSTSEISVTVTYPADGVVEFDAECMGEGTYNSYDVCAFSIDGTAQFTYGAQVSGWNHYIFDVPAGEHTFVWSYTKDSSVNPTGDYFAIDNVVLNKANVTWNDAIPTTENSNDFTISQAGEYWVHVQGVCDDESGDWSEPVVFDFTPFNCEAGIVLNEANPTWTENFDGITSITAPVVVEVQPSCWTWNRTTDLPEGYVDTLPHLYYNSSYAHSGSYSLRLWNRGVYAMPVLDENVDINRVKMSFYSRHSYSFYTMMVGVMTNPNDPSTFVPVAYVDNGSSTGVKYFECDFSKYGGQGRYIAFKNVRSTNNELDGHFSDVHSVNYIDDIVLTLMPESSCTIELADLPYSENFDAVTSSTNTVTGASPRCWKVVEGSENMSLVTAPQVYYNYSYAESGYYSLRMANRGVYAMPALSEDINIKEVQLSMYVRQPNALYQLQVGVWDEDNETFTPVALVNNSTTGLENFTCDFSNYDGSGRRIAFRNTLGGGKTWNYSYNYIDDVVLSQVECEKVSAAYTESFEDCTDATTAATGAAPACWDVVDGAETMSYNGYPQVYYNSDFANDGDYSLRMSDRCVYAMPELAEGVNLNSLSMTLYVRQPYSYYQLEVGVWDGTAFAVVETVNNSDDAVTPVTVDFGGYEGTGRIAFRNTLNGGKTWNYSYNYIDNISFGASTGAKNEMVEGGVNGAMDNDRYLDNIAVYPNPTTGVLHIDAVGVQKVECYSQMGQLVGVYDNVNELNISELADGVYMLRITVPQGVTMRKVVKR